jgi:cytoskeletal protein RodZ
MKELGVELQEARLAKGIKLEEIAHHTHIQLAHLQKIENGQLDFLPRPYVTAFIKTFAQYVGLSGETLVNLWREEEQAEAQRLQHQLQDVPPKKINTPRLTPLKPKSLATTTSASIPVAIPYLKEIALGFGMIILMAGLVFLMSRAGAKSPPMQTDNEATTSNREESASLEERPFAQVVKEAQEQNKPEPEQQRPPANELTLQAQFESQTRLRLVRDGQDTTLTVFRAGETKSWPAKEKFNLRLSAGSAVSLTLAGKSLGKFGQAGKIEYLTITRDGVTEQRAVTPPAKPRTVAPIDSEMIRRPRRN